MSKIILNNVSFSRNGQDILRRISMVFVPGTITSILGPTGCGKTTLLRIMAGLEVPQEGEIMIDEKMTTKGGKIMIESYQRNIGFIFQDLALWPHLTVYKNLSFGLEEKKDVMIKEKVYKLLENFGISDQINKYPHELSGGQKQLVAIARSLIMEPSILFLDEPVSNLDVKVEHKIIDHLKKIQLQNKMTMLWVMHNHKLAIDNSQNIAVMNEGKIEWQGTTTAIKESNNLFVKEFINY